MHRFIALLAFCALITVDCTQQSTQPAPVVPPSYALVSSSAIDGYNVEVYSDGLIAVGYTPLHVRITRQGTIVSDAHVTIIPDMDMGMKHHACPVEQPEEADADANGYFHGAAIFTMASPTAWTLTVSFHDHDRDYSGSITTKLPVAGSELVRTAVDSSSMKYVIAMQTPTQRVGMNDLSFYLYSTADGHDYVPVNGASVAFEPSMPSMGHGSSGNQQPAFKGNGLYSGRVNFTMTGDWEVRLNVTTPSGAALSATYPVTVR